MEITRCWKISRAWGSWAVN